MVRLTEHFGRLDWERMGHWFLLHLREPLLLRCVLIGLTCRQFNRESGESACLDELDRIRRCASKSAPTDKRSSISSSSQIETGFFPINVFCDDNRFAKEPKV